MTVSDSILDSTKKVLGIDSSYTVFDLDIMLHINSVFSTLQQLGVGPSDGFMITDNETTWSSYIGESKSVNMVKSYMYLRVRLLFDPPTTGFVTDAFDKQRLELEWRLNVAVDTNVSTTISDGGSTVTAADIAAAVEAYMLLHPLPEGGTVDPSDISAAVESYLNANPISDGLVKTQSTPISTWSFTHTLGRVPVVGVYVNGEEVEADVEATDTTITITFPVPTAGFAVLT